MALPIHEVLPSEVLLNILLRTARSADAHNFGYISSRAELPLRAAIELSSVCQGWRKLVTSHWECWQNISFKNFLSPSQSEAMDCINHILHRSIGRFCQVTLDFTSIKDADDAEAIICATLDGLLASALEVSSSSWRKLCILAANSDHLDCCSDYFLLTASESARAKLGAINTLRLDLALDAHLQKHPQTIPLAFETLPLFNTLYFKNLMRVHLTNVRIYIFPSNIRQFADSARRMFELCLDDWITVIDETIMVKGSINPDQDSPHDSQMPPFHVITNSPMNFVNSSFCSAAALTIGFGGQNTSPSSTALQTSPHEVISVSDETANSLNTPTVSTVARLFLKNNFTQLQFLHLNDATPKIWLSFLALLKPLPPRLLTNDPFLPPLPTLPWKCITVRFARSKPGSELNPLALSSRCQHEATCAPRNQDDELAGPSTVMASLQLNSSDSEEDELIRKIQTALGLTFDFESKLGRVQSADELTSLCFTVLNRNKLPDLEVFSCEGPNGRTFRVRASWNGRRV
jgi:hypothetical protein